MNFSAHSDGMAFPAFLAVTLMCLWVLLHIVLAVSVTRNIDKFREGGREPILLGSVGWGFLTVLTGPLGFAYYWAAHHSSWRDPQSDVRTSTTRIN